MIKVDDIEVWGFQHAIRGMRNPLNSWEKSDSGKNYKGTVSDGDYIYKVGPNDLDLMRRLYFAGPEHRKYLRQIFVSMDITAPLYWWKEFDTYKVGTVSNSCSTMHKIHAKEFVLEDFSTDHLNDLNMVWMQGIVHLLNSNRERYLKSKEKSDWWQLIQMLPSSYNQRRTITMNYENVMSMIDQRGNHKLDEWVTFCWTILRELPYVKEIREEHDILSMPPGSSIMRNIELTEKPFEKIAGGNENV